MRQHVVGEVRGDLAHTPGVAGGADAAALARERDQPLVAATLTTGPREAMGQNAALEVAPEVAFDPIRQSVAHGVGLGRASHEGLEVVLHRLVQSRLGRAPRTVDGCPGEPAMTRGLAGRGRSRVRCVVAGEPGSTMAQARIDRRAPPWSKRPARLCHVIALRPARARAGPLGPCKGPAAQRSDQVARCTISSTHGCVTGPGRGVSRRPDREPSPAR
jgi:hypothetical protein